MHKEQFDIAVIGAGTGGLVSAFLADSLGAKTALIEKNNVGGECLWTGCVPSKALIKAAKVCWTVKNAAAFGVRTEGVSLDWDGVRQHIIAARSQIQAHEQAEIGRSSIQILNGTARFTDHHTLCVASEAGERLIQARKFILATGSKSRVPSLDGLADTGFLTHEQIFDLPTFPASLLILGGGPIACEIAQAFQRLGSQVTIIEQGERLLPREEPEVSIACRQFLEAEGVIVHVNAHAQRARHDAAGKFIEFTVQGAKFVAHSEQLLVAVGKEPDFSSLNLAAAGVQSSERGLVVDDYLRTSASHVWACGDATGKYLFTHVAEYQAKIAAQNALLPVKTKANYRVVPWATFTDPEIAHLGLTEAEARQKHGCCKVYQVPFSQVDRAIIEGQTEGFIKIITAGSGRVLGVHIVGLAAGELIHNFVPALRDGALIQEFAESIHVYPTLAEIGHRAGNEYYRDLLRAPAMQWLLPRIVGRAKHKAD